MKKWDKSFLKSKIALAYITSRAFTFPIWGLVLLIPHIIYNDFGNNPFLSALCFAMKPIATLISPLWSQRVSALKKPLKSRLIVGNFLQYLPFALLFFVQSKWYYILAIGIYMFFYKATQPTWMEVLRLNIKEKERSKVCAFGSTVEHIGLAIFPFIIRCFLDNNTQAWNLLFPAAAFLGMLSTVFLINISLDLKSGNDRKIKTNQYRNRPWSICIDTLKKPDFLRFQLGFFIGGASLMIINPALPVCLGSLSYFQILLVRSGVKGLGYSMSSPFWVSFFNKSNIFNVCFLVTLFASLFPLFLIFSKGSVALIAFSYIIYGIMQSGNDLSWKLSGPFFSGDEDSRPYSTVNILASGIRGMVFPFIGSLILSSSGGALASLLIGSLSCAVASIFFLYSKSRSPVSIKSSV